MSGDNSLSFENESSNMTVEAPSNSDRIRANFLNRLGIDDQKNAPQPPRDRSLLGNVQVTQEPLKFQDMDAELSEEKKGGWSFFGSRPSETNLSDLACSPETSVSSESTGAKKPQITFNTEVKVVPIPMRDEYSKRVKERLWTNAEDIQMNAYRNSVEFASEGWDWRTALEDENMYRDAASGELIHPVHCIHQDVNEGEGKL